MTEVPLTKARIVNLAIIVFLIWLLCLVLFFFGAPDTFLRQKLGGVLLIGIFAMPPYVAFVIWHKWKNQKTDKRK